MDPNNTSDLTSLVSKIMAHPELIEQISSLMREEEAPPATRASTQSTETNATGAKETVSEQASNSLSEGTDKRENRKRLLAALRPFLSERRSRALDSVETVATLFDLGGR